MARLIDKDALLEEIRDRMGGDRINTGGIRPRDGTGPSDPSS